jgi:7-cyano-7-deazaguanine synthase in queuosine biosynthesis
MKKRIILTSGGIDSTLAFDHYERLNDGYENIPVFIDYGQKYLVKESKAVDKLFGDRVVKLKIDNETDADAQNPFIPARNLTLASYMATRFNPDEIVMAGLKDDVVVDKNPEAFKEMSYIISKFSKKQITITSPFWELTKGEIIEEFLKNGGSEQRLLSAVSCYESGDEGVHCNDCPACFRRWVALDSNGITVDTPTKRIIDEYLPRIWKYDTNRVARTFIAIKKVYKVIAMDLDGVLTAEINGFDYINRTPRVDKIIENNKLFDEGNVIVIYTSRLHSDREVTEQWLNANGVKYSTLITDKLPYDVIYDDRAITVERV